MVSANLLNDINLILLDSPNNLGILDWNLKVQESVICDDDITYLNNIMGVYMFNSEFLFRRSSMPNLAKKDDNDIAKRYGVTDDDFDPDYFKSDKLAKVYLDLRAY